MKNTVRMLASVQGGQMNSFIVTSEDGKVVVIDGGYRSDAGKLLETLKNVTGEAIPHIDAWILTHAHLDHIDAFMEILDAHAGEISFDKVYFNFPSVPFLEKNEPGEAHTVREFYERFPLFSGKVNIVTQGDEYEVGRIGISFLYTFEPDFTSNAINNSSSVFRLTLGGKTFLFLGDLGVEGGRKLLSMHREGLESDYVQMAHHGQNGVTKEVYRAVKPHGCFWCTPKWLWDNDAGGGYDTHIWKTVEVRGWMEQLGVKEHYVMKDGDQILVL